MSKELTAAKGNKVVVDFGGGKEASFIAGGRKRREVGHGWVFVNGRIRFADGTEAYCLLEISELDSGEHFGTHVFLPNGTMTSQNEKGFLRALGKTKEQVYPYKYKYTAKINCYDHHIGEDGWSH